MRRVLTLAAVISALAACGGPDEPPAEVAAPLTAAEALAEIGEAFAAATAPEPPTEIAEPVAAEAPAPEAGPAPRTLRLQHGESLALVAQWLGGTPEALAQANDLSMKARLDVGHTINYEATDAQQAKLEAARAAFSEQRLASFLKRRGGLVEVIDHRVRRGQSLWLVARRNRLPMWVMAHYNPGRDLNTLAPGDTIKLPVLGDGLTARR
jgi:LysM repeat protein